MTDPTRVPQELAQLWLRAAWGPADWARLEAYQRKLDIRHGLVTAYDAELRQPMSDELLPAPACATLVCLCIRACEALKPGDPADDEAARGHRLSWLNSAWRAWDCLAQADPDAAAPYRAQLQALLAREASA